jgi:hypothetical protein
MRVFRLEVNTELLDYDKEFYSALKLATLIEFATMITYYRFTTMFTHEHEKFQIKQRTRQVIYKMIRNVCVPGQKKKRLNFFLILAHPVCEKNSS